MGRLSSLVTLDLSGCRVGDDGLKRLAMVTDAGHSVYFERRREFNALLDTLLAEGDAAPVVAAATGLAALHSRFEHLQAKALRDGPAEFEALRRTGIRFVQGYLLGAPGPAPVADADQPMEELCR